MKPNIFRIADQVTLGPEDALTAYWHYLLSTVPGLGQAFVDQIAKLSGIAPSRFLGAIDHPAGDRSNHPDLLIQCSDGNVLFEHKLGSGLGPRQLHRYLDLAARRNWQLALLSADRMEIDAEVLKAPQYLRPAGSTRAAHFLWEDVHAVVGGSDHHLAREFCEYLEDLGLGRFSWSGRGSPFVDSEAAAAVISLYDAVRPIFAGTGASCRRSANSLIYQIRTPFPMVHLINFAPLQSVAQRLPELRGPVMALWIWMRRTDPTVRVLPMKDGMIGAPAFRVFIRDYDSESLPYDRRLIAERSYYTSLESILQPSLKDSRDRLIDFVNSAVAHLRTDLASMSQPVQRASTDRADQRDRNRHASRVRTLG